MALDLSALDGDEDTTASNGRKVYAPHSMFYEDPDQPRKEIDPEADAKDRADFARRGVQTSITVRPPDASGRMKIIFGARRFRLSQEAGCTEIPYVIEEDSVKFDDYAQVAENERRKGLSPMDMAVFIQKRKLAGDKNAYIASQIGIDASEVTHHLALVEAPDFIRELYTLRKCRTPKYLYELGNLAKEFPEQVQRFCAGSDDFSRKAIQSLNDTLKNLGNTKEPEDSTSLGLGSTSTNSGSTSSDVATKPPATTETQATTFTIPGHNPEIEKDTEKERPLPDPNKMKKPLLLATYNDDDVMVMLYKRPTSPGLVHIKFENGTGETEIAFSDLTNLTLTESAI